MKNASRELTIFVVGLVVGIVLAVVVPFVVGVIADLGPEGDDPLDYVTVVDDIQPVAPRIPTVAARLDSSTGVKWEAPLLVHSTTAAVRTTLTEGRIATLTQEIAVPDVEEYSVQGIATNVESSASVQANGAFYLVAISRLKPAQDWLVANNRIFVDDAQEKARVTFRAGSLIFYYAPTGEVDQTDAIRRYVNEVVRCPRDLGPCPS